MLLSYANVQFYQELMAAGARCHRCGEFAAFAEDVSRRYATSDDYGR